ncbi:holin family protein [Desulfovibrio gilichinskyi]|uniref:Holin of 3TMs, for gene-transfer release n=1 Tax=Desulfovibrio gilichinskyi TaxID=1519643 RepID=A0A1X7C1H7_9BACT|nr:holin family protein [Desulfovibrio gilichinskyi]SME88324.1 Holin of 3TMs, for gene-transfer release [Desulfovibrio gilichinskyi]
MIGSILDLGSTIIDKIWPDAGDREKAKLKLVELQSKGELVEIESRLKIMLAEMSGNWLQRSWRPILMLTIITIVANNYLLYPYMSLFWAEAPKLELPPQLWSLMQLGLSGYVVGRSAEKVVKTWRENGG